MSWRKAAELARQLAEEAHQEAAACGVDQDRAAALRDHLRAADQPALAAWLRRRRAQVLASFADECAARSSTDDVTVLARQRKP